MRLTGHYIRSKRGVLVMPCFLLCTAAAIAMPAHSGLDRECLAAALHARAAACGVSDLDGDRQADYAFSLNAAGSSASPATISIHLSRAPKAYQLVLPQGVVASSFILRDVNGDGWIDIALLGGFDETVGVFLNDGSGEFQFDHQQRYVTAPNRDTSELTPPARCVVCGYAVCASDCTVSSPAGARYRSAATNFRIAAIRSTPLRRPNGVARSRAP